MRQIGQMWRNAKTVKDSLGALQALSLLLLPANAKTMKWTHADIIELTSERKEINVGDPVLVNTKGRNSRRCGTCIRKYECDGVQFYDVAPPAPSLKSMSATRSFDKRQPCSFMTRVLFSDIEHADSLICRPGEARFFFLIGRGE